MLVNSVSSSFQLHISEIQNTRNSCPVGSTVFAKQRSRRRCILYDFHKELLPYSDAWSWQKTIVDEKAVLSKKNEDLSDSLIVLQHQPVYTLGTGSSLEFVNFDIEDSSFDLYRTERGGEVTYHGPGQYHKRDLHWYLRALEEVVVRALFSGFAVKASRIDGLTGVWVGDKKLAAIGIKVSQWIAYHGLALNVTTDLAPFHRIVPCGIRDRQVGTVKDILRDDPQSGGFRQEMDDSVLIDHAYRSRISAFSEVFGVSFD